MFETLKILIENNAYDKNTILKKAKLYLKAEKITQEEYDELLKIL